MRVNARIVSPLFPPSKALFVFALARVSSLGFHPSALFNRGLLCAFEGMLFSLFSFLQAFTDYINLTGLVWNTVAWLVNRQS